MQATLTYQRRVQHLLHRMRLDVAKAELMESAYEEGKAGTVDGRPSRKDATTAKIEWQKSPTAKDLNSTGEWAWRREVGYALAIQAERAAYETLPPELYVNPQRHSPHPTVREQERSGLRPQTPSIRRR